MKAEFTMTYTFRLEGSSKEQLAIKRDLLLATISDARREADNAGYGYLVHGRDSALRYEVKCDRCGK